MPSRVQQLDRLRQLSRTFEPDVAIVTRIAVEHLEFLGSLDAVAQANGEILEGLKPQGVFVANADGTAPLAPHDIDTYQKLVVQGTLNALIQDPTIRSLRNQYAADMVVLVSEDAGYCGWSSLTMANNNTDAYSVVWSSCLSSQSRSAGTASASTWKMVRQREQRTFAPRAPIRSSATRNFALQFVQMTIIRAGPLLSDYTAHAA